MVVAEKIDALVAVSKAGLKQDEGLKNMFLGASCPPVEDMEVKLRMELGMVVWEKWTKG